MTDTPEFLTETPGARSSHSWFVAQLKPNGFLHARQNLHRQGFSTFMPMRETEVRHARKRVMVLRPLFPGYIFVNFDADLTQWRAINNTYGVMRLISERRDRPQMAPPPLMAALLGQCDENDVVLPPAELSPGDVVRITDGPFRDLVARVVCMTAQSRVSLLLDLMGRATRAELALDDLELAAS